MNIFFLDSDPAVAARAHVDSHVVKMVLESAQMLSTAHRVLDGTRVRVPNPQAPNKFLSARLLPGETADVEFDEKTERWKLVINNKVCYQVAHANHPCSVWVRQTDANYYWLYRLMLELDLERRYRFNPEPSKSIRELAPFLANAPKNIREGAFTKPPQAMPEIYKSTDPTVGYKNYYIHGKTRLAKWTKRSPPGWFNGVA